MPSPAAIRAARDMICVEPVGFDYMLSVAGSSYGFYAGRSLADDARDAIAYALSCHFVDFVDRAAKSITAFPVWSYPTNWAPWDAIVTVERVAEPDGGAYYTVRVCGQDLPGAEPLAQHERRLAAITHGLACALDQALGELVSIFVFHE